MSIHKRLSCSQIFRKFQILPLAALYILEVLCFIKDYEGNLPQNFAIHSHNTRNEFDLPTRYCSTVLYQRSVTDRGIKLFDILPIQIKQLNNHKGFEREVKSCLLCNSLCTVEAFLQFVGIYYCTLC
jgi:hypothetical protein